MAAITSAPVEVSYEEFVKTHAEQFGRYLAGKLGRQGEGRGGRVGVEDTLQEALLRIYARWPELTAVPHDERDRRLYRYLRDAAAQALRDEHGRRGRRERPQIIAFDFGRLDSGRDDQTPRERELEATMLGTFARDVAGDDGGREARAALDRAILVGGLRALAEHEAVVLLAVDHLGWDQEQLAVELGMAYSTLRRTLFVARELFYSLVRHAVDLEVGEEERGRLFAYQAGELSGKDKRQVARHLRHCTACQQLEREQRVFQRGAVQVLSPLPFVFGARFLARRAPTKLAALGSGVGPGLFAQPGAAKAAAAVMALLALGGGAAAVIGQLNGLPVDRAGPAPAVSAGLVGVTVSMKRPEPAVSAPAHAARQRHRTRRRAHHRSASSSGSTLQTTRSSPLSTSAGAGATTPPASTTGASSSKPRTSSSSGAGRGSLFGE